MSAHGESDKYQGPKIWVWIAWGQLTAVWWDLGYASPITIALCAGVWAGIVYASRTHVGERVRFWWAKRRLRKAQRAVNKAQKLMPALPNFDIEHYIKTGEMSGGR
jgi:hypothetical protein